MRATIRADLAEAHRLAWEHVASPGSWFDAEQRVELATTVLTARDDDSPLPPWVGFGSASGRLAAGAKAPVVAHDLAYRLARHAATMTEPVYRRAAVEIGALAYVELCALVSTVAAVAHFCRNVGIVRPPFPSPRPGAATQEQPAELEQATLNWVPVAAPADRVAAVVQAYTAVPAEHVNTWRLADAQYMPDAEMVHPDWTRRPGGLSRVQMEIVAARVAQLRDCFY